MSGNLDEGKRARLDALYTDPTEIYTEEPKNLQMSNLEDKKVQRTIVAEQRELAQTTPEGRGIGMANVQYNPLSGTPMMSKTTKAFMLALAFYVTGVI